jgi:outer membrane protein
VGVIKTVLWGTAAALVLATSPAWAELKIGVVNVQRLLQESPQAKEMQARWRTDFGPRQRALTTEQQQLKAREDKYQRDSATMTDDQRVQEEKHLRDAERDWQIKQSEWQDDFNARRNEDLSKLQRTLSEEVMQYAKTQNYDLVLTEVAYSTAAIDITPAILTRLQQVAVKPGTGAAPKGTKSDAGQ